MKTQAKLLELFCSHLADLVDQHPQAAASILRKMEMGVREIVREGEKADERRHRQMMAEAKARAHELEIEARRKPKKKAVSR